MLPDFKFQFDPEEQGHVPVQGQGWTSRLFLSFSFSLFDSPGTNQHCAIPNRRNTGLCETDTKLDRPLRLLRWKRSRLGILGYMCYIIIIQLSKYLLFHSPHNSQDLGDRWIWICLIWSGSARRKQTTDWEFARGVQVGDLCVRDRREEGNGSRQNKGSAGDVTTRMCDVPTPHIHASNNILCRQPVVYWHLLVGSRPCAARAALAAASTAIGRLNERR